MFVNITGNINAGEINTAVEVLKSTSTLAKTPAPGIVYKYINIWVGTSGFAGPKNIKNARIMFKLENTWLTSGDIKDADIVLLRWDGTQWVSLETALSHKDDTFSYYEAGTASFSPFAISSVKAETAPAATTSGVSSVTTTPVTTTTETTQAKSTPGFGFVFTAGVISAVYMLRRKRM
jgi:PGF-pre-PGF domain-containing protein